MKILPKGNHFDAVQSLYDEHLEETQARMLKEYQKTYKEVLQKTQGTYYELLQNQQDGTELITDYYRYGMNYEYTQQLNRLCSALAGKETDILQPELVSMFEKTTQLIGRELGVMPLSKERAEMAAGSIWCQDGKLWSQRIWQEHRPQLVNQLADGMVNIVTTGASPKALAKEIQTAFGKSFYECDRLVRTELASIMNRSSSESYQSAGISFMRVLTAGDPCPQCQELSEKVVPVSEICLPQHPNCRCCFVAEITD